MSSSKFSHTFLSETEQRTTRSKSRSVDTHSTTAGLHQWTGKRCHSQEERRIIQGTEQSLVCSRTRHRASASSSNDLSRLRTIPLFFFFSECSITSDGPSPPSLIIQHIRVDERHLSRTGSLQWLTRLWQGQRDVIREHLRSFSLPSTGSTTSFAVEWQSPLPPDARRHNDAIDFNQCQCPRCRHLSIEFVVVLVDNKLEIWRQLSLRSHRSDRIGFLHEFSIYTESITTSQSRIGLISRIRPLNVEQWLRATPRLSLWSLIITRCFQTFDTSLLFAHVIQLEHVHLLPSLASHYDQVRFVNQLVKNIF